MMLKESEIEFLQNQAQQFLQQQYPGKKIRVQVEIDDESQQQPDIVGDYINKINGEGSQGNAVTRRQK